MVFGTNPINLETMLSGSHVAFKSRERVPLSDSEQELKYGNERTLQRGIYILRKLRTLALAEQDSIKQQSALIEAHQLAEQMAEVILNLSSSDKPVQIGPSFLEIQSRMESKYKPQDADSGHFLPAQFSIGNLFRAADDMLVRVEERAQSIYKPNHVLTREDVNYVLQEFLRGTNDLTVDAIRKLCDHNTRWGGILSGGSVYTEMARQIIQKYADPSLLAYSFVVAVDKDKKKSAFETSESDNATQTVILLDDVIDGGGTMLTALWSAGQYFPNATIHSGKGTDYAGGFEKRRVQKHMDHLCGLFQDFADLSEDGKMTEALAVFKRAESYAEMHNVQLQSGWYKRKERLKIG